MATTEPTADEGRRRRQVQFDDHVETVSPPRNPRRTKTVRVVGRRTQSPYRLKQQQQQQQPEKSPPPPPKERRSWSPLRKSRRQQQRSSLTHDNNAAAAATDEASLVSAGANSAHSGTMSHASSSQRTPVAANISRRQQQHGRIEPPPSTTRRRGWFGVGGRQQQQQYSSPSSPKKQQRGQAPSSAYQQQRQRDEEEAALHKETEKLVRTLVKGGGGSSSSSHRTPLSADAVQEAYFKALDLQQEMKELKSNGNDKNDDDDNGRELREANVRVKQLTMELSAAQKAASQLAASNLRYEQQLEALAEQLEFARERVEELEKGHAAWERSANEANDDNNNNSAAAGGGTSRSGSGDDGDENVALAAAAEAKAAAAEAKTLREQLSNAKRAMIELQSENVDLKKAASAYAKDNDDEDAELESLRDNNSLNSSFELQLSLQKDLARVTARVHRLEAEKVTFVESQRRMEEVLRQVEQLEEENRRLVNENDSLRLQLECSKAETARALAAAKSAPSPKDMVLSSSQLATATTIIGRLTEECKTLSHREKELTEQLKRLETKNKNQKEIFQTALEIKQVELKIYEQESKTHARKVEELNQTIDELHYHQQTAPTVIPVAAPTPPPEVDPVLVEELQTRVGETEDQLRKSESANQDLESRIEDLQVELEERKNRVSELEELLRTEKESIKEQIEKETSQLSEKVRNLSGMMRDKQEDLQKLQDELEDERKESEYRTQVRVNELTEQLNDYEMSLEEREERIQELEEKLKEQEEQLTQNNKTSPRSVIGFDQEEEQAEYEQSSKLAAIRQKRGAYENLMRSKMNRVQEIDRRASFEEQPTQVSSNDSSSREESPPPMMVFATPVGDSRVVEMEASLRASDERTEELRKQLADAQVRLSQVQEAAEQASDERYSDMEASLKRSEDRIKDLKEQLSQAHHRLGQAQQFEKPETREMDVQVDLVPPESDEDRARLEEMTVALQQSNDEVISLREQVAQAETKLEELRAEQSNLSREESCMSAEDQAAMTALEEELEEFRQKYDDECDRRKALGLKVEKIVEERDEALESLQHAEYDLLEKQNNLEELVKELDETKARLVDSHKHMRKNSLVPTGRVAGLEAELEEAREQLKEADMKIEMLEQFIEEETASNLGATTTSASPSPGASMSAMQAESDIKRKDEELKLLRTEVERTRKELFRNKERVETLEQERNYSTAKLKELSSIMKTKAGSEAEVQLYNKCIECAELSADKDDLTNKLRASQASTRRLEQEISATKQMVTDISESWDSATTADQNVVRLKKEHSESIAKATTLSIELAESQMKINELEDLLATAEKANKSYAEELNSRPGIFRVIASAGRSSSRSQSRSRQNSPERNNQENAELRRLKQRIALLEDQNAAYEASLSAFSSLHENMQNVK